MPQYLSTDPNAGLSAPRTTQAPRPATYLSTDPNAGNTPPAAAPARQSLYQRDANGRMVRDANGRSVRLVPGMPATLPAARHPAAVIGDVAIGAAKGLGNTVAGLGEIVHRLPGVSTAIDALYGDDRPDFSKRSFESARQVTAPTNTPQQVGYTGEQIGEFFIPSAAVARGARVAGALKSGVTSLAQSGDLGSAGLSTAITAAIPGASGAARAASGLRQSAEKEVVRALGPTKEWAKSEAAKIAPQMLDRGVKGSRDALLTQAKQRAATVGQQLDDAYTIAAANGETVSGQVVRGALQLSGDALKVRNAQGALTAIPGTERVVSRLDKLERFVGTLGDDIPVDKAATVKRTLDKIVSKSGLYGQKAGATATDNADAWATREAAGAFRELINRNPTIATLNGEAAFWAGLKNVLKETDKRTQAQSGGLVAAGMGGSGAIVGAVSGDSLGERAQNALIGGLVGKNLIRVIQSPAFRTRVTAPLKDTLASALASGKTGPILSALSKITASLPAQVRP